MLIPVIPMVYNQAPFFLVKRSEMLKLKRRIGQGRAESKSKEKMPVIGSLAKK